MTSRTLSSGSRPSRSRQQRLTAALAAGAVAGAGLIASTPAVAEPPTVPVYQDDSGQYTFEVRAADLVSRMTRAEKIQQFRAERQHNGNIAPAIPRLGVAAYNYWNEALHGVARAAEDSAHTLNNGGQATEFPTGLGIAATWNRSLVRSMASATSDEARAMNNFTSASIAANKGLTYWSPTINMHRDPRWGRAEETYGEDPFLTSEIGGQFVTGMQGTDDTYLKTVTTPKHFLANNSENNRHTGSSDLTETELREYYTPAFADLAGSKYGAASLMTAYNRVNGVPVSASRELIETLARRTWGFNGVVVSDCDAVRDVWWAGGHAYQPEELNAPLTARQAVGYTLKSGVDLDCMDQDYPNYLEGSYSEGSVTEADMDVALTRAFTQRFRLGEFDSAENVPWRNDTYTIENQVSSAAHLSVSQQMSDEAVVMLKNDRPAGGSTAALPLTRSDAENIVVVGPLAEREVHGDYSPTKTLEHGTALQGIEEAAAAINPAANVTYIPGMNNAGFDNRRKPSIGTTVNGTRAAVRFLDADGAELGRVAPAQIIASGDYEGWRGLQPWSTSTDSLSTLGAWGGYFGITTSVPEGTVTVEVDQSGQAMLGGRFDVRVGSTLGSKVATVDALGVAAVGAYSGPVGAQQLYFVYENDAFEPEFTEEEVAAIRNADAVVAYVGTIAGNNSTYPAITGNPSDSSEDEDRASIDLPRGQDALVEAVAGLNARTVVYIQAVSQVDIDSFSDDVPTILWSTYNGQYQGDTVGRILFGRANPSGKLPFTFYTDIAQLPNTKDYTMTPTDGRAGRTYQYFTGDVLYPFGHGLSYSTFRYANLRLDSSEVDVNGTLRATVDVTNISDRDGKEVVQLYVSSPNAADPYRPDSQLKGFSKVPIPAHATKTVSIAVDASDLWFWDAQADHKTFDLGTWQLAVGPSSDASEGLGASFELLGALRPEVETVAVVPDGTTLNAAAPANVIHANLSATRNDQSFYDLSTVDVAYTSSDPEVAVVDGAGTVSPVGAGVVTITATVTADGSSKSTTFPVVVYDGAFAAGDVTLFDQMVSFGDVTVTLPRAQNGVELAAAMVVPAEGATYAFSLALNEENSAGAAVTPSGEFTATQLGSTRVTVVADVAGVKYARTATVTVRQAPEGGFSDVAAGSDFYDEIRWLVQQEIAEGYADGTFRPLAPISRQAMAAFIYRLVNDGADAPACTEAPFSDVSVSDQFCGEIAWMVDQGLAEGYPDGTFRPLAPISRQAMAAFIYRLVNDGAGAPVCTEAPFSDVPVGNEFCGEIAWMVDQELANGYSDGTFRPTRAVSRQAMAAFLYRLEVA